MIRIRRLAMHDGRPAKAPYTDDELKTDVATHRQSVKSLMDVLGAAVKARGGMHDATKTTRFFEYADQVRSNHRTGTHAAGWLETVHAVRERHHLDIHVPDGVNLIDLLEYMADKCIDGVERTGEFVQMPYMSPELLNAALENTWKLMQAKING